MLVALIARDKPGALDVRMATRDKHVAFLKSSDIVRQAGPLLDEAGDMCGSLIILEVDDMDVARNWSSEDPYVGAGLFASVELVPWNRVIGG